MLVPQIILVDDPPIASASEVLGSKLEKVAGSDGPSRTGTPFSSTKRRRLRLGVAPKISEWMSPRLELLIPELPGAEDLEERTNRPLLLVGTLGSCAPFTARVGLEEGAYRMGDESAAVSDWLLHDKTFDLPPGGVRGVLPAIEASFKGELIFMRSSPLAAAAGEER